METWSGTLQDHGTRYPQMEPRDAVKLAYQSEFAGGHLIRDLGVIKPITMAVSW